MLWAYGRQRMERHWGGTWQEKEAVASHTTSRSPIRIARPTAAAAGHECAYLVYVLRGSRPRLN